MSEPKSLTPETEIPLFLPKKPVSQNNCCKIKETPVDKEKIVELNIKPEILSQINEKKKRNMKLFPSRPLMGYNWYKWEDRGQDPNGAADRLYRNMKNTPPSIYSSYSLDSSTGMDPTRSRRSRHFPSLRCNIKFVDMKPTIPSHCNSGMIKAPLPMLSSFSHSPCIIEPKSDKGSKGVKKGRIPRRGPCSDGRYSLEGVSRKKERNVSFKTMRGSNKNEFWAKDLNIQKDIKSYVPRSFSVSHNEYMANFQSYSDESDVD